MPTLDLREETTLPADGFAGALAARVWRPDVNGPSVVAVRDNGVFDVSAAFPTMRDLCESASPAEALRAAEGPRLGALSDILANTPRDSRGPSSPHLLAPIDLQAIKAAGVTFAESSARARDRGARARQPRRRGEGARRDRERSGRRSQQSQARLARGDAAQGGARQGRRLVAISGGRHRPRRRGLHQEPADVGGRIRRRRRLPQRLALEQSRTGGRARGRLERRDRRRDARQRRQSARFRGALGASARQGQGPERELRDRPLLALLRRDVHARRRAAGDDLARGRGRGRLPARRRLVDGQDQPRSERSRRAKRSARTTPIPTGSSSCSARCSRRSPIAALRAWVSRTRPAISSRSAPRSSDGSSIACGHAKSANAGRSASAR